VIKHANAARAQVTVQFVPDLLKVSTTDNGVGFDAGVAGLKPTLGMSTMRERAEGVDGRLVVESAPGRGTRVSAELPIPRAD
jgi:signal transduction histidine kinase